MNARYLKDQFVGEGTIWLDQAAFMRLGNQDTDRVNIEQAKRYIRHLLEEAQETATADEGETIVGTVDGLVDSIVVAAGALISLLGPDGAQQAWNIVMDCNLAKVDGRHGPIRWREDLQIGKPSGWVGPEFALEQLCRDRGLI